MLVLGLLLLLACSAGSGFTVVLYWLWVYCHVMLVLGLLPCNTSFGSTALQCWFWVYCHVGLVLGLLPHNAGFVVLALDPSTGCATDICVIVQAVVHYNELGSAVNVLLCLWCCFENFTVCDAAVDILLSVSVVLQ